MQAATDAMTSIDDPNLGDIETEYNALQNQIVNHNQQITDDQARVNLMQTNLQDELTQADAAIAALQSQKTYYTELFQAEYNNNGTGSGG
jgi:peptidoglycan hydrolase CwlO-like protein